INISSGTDKKEDYIFSESVKMLRWENGRWALYKETSFSDYGLDEDSTIISYSENGTAHFNPQEYNYCFQNNPGYYKIDLSAHNSKSGAEENFSVLFEAV
ncbi:MAG: hypothetical protein J1E40_00100, partial [Oscillospiraceae bacterium]|nr:hypothetical protein [Oscillospiraceae bacterium]